MGGIKRGLVYAAIVYCSFCLIGLTATAQGTKTKKGASPKQEAKSTKAPAAQEPAKNNAAQTEEYLGSFTTTEGTFDVSKITETDGSIILTICNGNNCAPISPPPSATSFKVTTEGLTMEGADGYHLTVSARLSSGGQVLVAPGVGRVGGLPGPID